MQETISTFNADLTLKFTPIEAIEQLKSKPQEPSNGKESPNQENSEAKFRFTYSKNEVYQQFLSHSSKKVRPNT